MELRVRYQSQFSYPAPVRNSHNVLRACPAEDGGQRLLSYQLEINPPARVLSYIDAWGTRVDAFGIDEPHSELTVVAESAALTTERPQPDDPVTRDECLVPRFQEDHWDYLQPTRHTGWSPQLAEAAQKTVAELDTVQGAVRAIEELVRSRLVYRPGATAIGVDVNRVFESGAGVCQDFVHLTLALLRAIQIPARYVSGYFYSEDSATGTLPSSDEIEVQTHAWVEVAVPGFGWWGVDPTNAAVAGERHLKIGHGRDYDDVLPLRGVYVGEVDHELAAGVTMSVHTLSAVRFQQTHTHQAQTQQ